MLYSLTVYVSVVCSIHVVVVCLLYEWIPSQCISLCMVVVLKEVSFAMYTCLCCMSGFSLARYVAVVCLLKEGIPSQCMSICIAVVLEVFSTMYV